MTEQQEQHRQHLKRQLRFMEAATHPKVRDQPAGYEIPNTPYGVPKVAPYEPPKIAEIWIDRQKKLHSSHKEPWFKIEDGPRGVDQNGDPLPPKIGDIQREVCAHYGVRRYDLLSSRRTQNLALPRHVVFYLSRRLTHKSFTEVGRQTGKRDHTTAMHGVRRVNLWLAADPRLQASIEMLVDRLGGDPE